MFGKVKKVFVIILLIPVVSYAQEKSRAVLTTGITGTIKSSGLDNPMFVLSFPQIQNLLLEANKKSVTMAEINKAVSGTPVKFENLMNLELLRQTKDGFRTAYTVLSIEDQRLIFRIAQKYGADLAKEFRKRQSEIDRIISKYPDASRRNELKFGLIAGLLLNWEGLKLNSELGYRATPKERKNGEKYILHSEEIGANLDEKGMYWGSHSFPGDTVAFSTFGDGESIPRLNGIPDVFFGPADAGLEKMKDSPAIHQAMRDELIAYFSIAINDAGNILNTLAGNPGSEQDLAKQLNISESRMQAALGLLSAAGYIEKKNNVYQVNVPFLQRKDKTIVVETLKLGRNLLKDWLIENYEKIKNDLTNLSPLKNELDFNLLFNTVWHYVFGWTTKYLSENGFYINPRSSDYRYKGFVPLVWDLSLYELF